MSNDPKDLNPTAAPSMYDIMRKEKRKLTKEELQEFYKQALEQQGVTEVSDPLAEGWIQAQKARGWK
jgi:hypothetical protein